MTSSIKAYFKAAQNAPYLDPKTETYLARKWAYDKDEKALKKLTSAYLRRALALVSRFTHYGLPYPDLVQEASLGLMVAASRFDPERGVRFSTYADWWIRARLQDYVFRHWSIVRMGTTSAHKSVFFNFRRLSHQFRAQNNNTPDEEIRKKIAEELNVRNRDVDHIAHRIEQPHFSLNMPLAEGTHETWQNQIESPDPTPEEDAINTLDTPLIKQELNKALSQLNARERYILTARYLCEQRKTLEQLGHTLNVSKERIRQIEQKALGKLKEMLKPDQALAHFLEPA